MKRLAAQEVIQPACFLTPQAWRKRILIAKDFGRKQRLRQMFEREEKHYCGMRTFSHSEEAGKKDRELMKALLLTTTHEWTPKFLKFEIGVHA